MQNANGNDEILTNTFFRLLDFTQICTIITYIILKYG
jgi:hypothetical protein